jgi:hypothetical protein
MVKLSPKALGLAEQAVQSVLDRLPAFDARVVGDELKHMHEIQERHAGPPQYFELSDSAGELMLRAL